MATATQTMRRANVPARTRGSTNIFRQMFDHRADYLYILPALAAMGLVILYPLVKVVWLSFRYTSPYGGTEHFVGLSNYSDAIHDEHFGVVVRNTLVWTAGSTIIALALGMVAALLVSRPMRFRGIIRGILIIPNVISAVTAAFVWKWMYNADFGVLSGLLIQMHLISQPIKFIDSTNLVMPAAIVVNVWKEYPFAMILLLAGLQTIPEQLYNAAKVDGAGRWRRFTDITVPQLMPVILVTSILLIIQNVNAFTLIWILTGGGPAYHSQIFITHVYSVAFVGSPHFELAAALGVIIFIPLMIFAVFYVRLLTRQSRSRRVIEAEGEGGEVAIGASPGSDDL